MSLTKVPLNAITAKKIGTTANTTSGANVVLLANVAPGSDLVSNQVGLLKGNFVDFVSGGAGTHAQGSVSSYISGGHGNGTYSNDTILKFPFSAGGSTSDVAELYDGMTSAAGASSREHGYLAGGSSPGDSNIIQKFPFSSDSPGSDVGELIQARYVITGTESESHGYAMGGQAPYQSIIEKFPFSSDSSSTDVGELINTPSPYAYGMSDGAGAASSTHGYYAGGFSPAPPGTAEGISKFPFSSDTPSTLVGSMVTGNIGGSAESGANSETHGYSYVYGDIHKWSFVSDSDASMIMENAPHHPASQIGMTCTSSTTNGYASGARQAPVYVDSINIWPFASETNSTDFGELSVERGMASGAQI